MVILADIEERSFRSLVELKGFLTTRKKKAYEIPLSELSLDEDGWHPTEAQQYLMRLVCENGQIGFDRTDSFHRSPRSREGVAESFEILGVFFENIGEVEKLAEGVKWAAEHEIRNQRDDVLAMSSLIMVQVNETTNQKST